MPPLQRSRYKHLVAIAGAVAMALTRTPPSHAISSRILFAPIGAAANDSHGFSVAAAGDFNSDGFADVVVGAPANDAAGNDAGRAYVYFARGSEAVGKMIASCMPWSRRA